jgi:hypothetical protein
LRTHALVVEARALERELADIRIELHRLEALARADTGARLH